MAHPFSIGCIAEKLLDFCTVAWADDLDRCAFADLARTSREFAEAARALRAANEGCIDHCADCVTWRGAVELSLVREHLLARTRGAGIVGGIVGAALRSAVKFHGLGYLFVGRWIFEWDYLDQNLNALANIGSSFSSTIRSSGATLWQGTDQDAEECAEIKFEMTFFDAEPHRFCICPSVSVPLDVTVTSELSLAQVIDPLPEDVALMNTESTGEYGREVNCWFDFDGVDGNKGQLWFDRAVLFRHIQERKDFVVTALVMTDYDYEESTE